jgi:hypothetical protein
LTHLTTMEPKMCVCAHVYVHVFRIRTTRSACWSCVRKWHKLAADAYGCTNHVELDMPAMHRKQQRPINWWKKSSQSIQLLDMLVYGWFVPFICISCPYKMFT